MVVKHPCAGRSTRQIAVFEAVCGGLQPTCRKNTINALIRAGLVEQVCGAVTMLHADGGGVIAPPIYQVPLRHRNAWRLWLLDLSRESV